MSKLISEGGFGCVFYPAITCKGKIKKSKKNITKIQKNSFNSKNEIKNGKLITSISGYNLYFLPVVSNCKLKLRKNKFSNIELDKCELISHEDSKFIAMDIPYLKQIEFTQIISERKPQEIILTIIESYRYLLTCLDKLIGIEMVHFDLKLENILFREETTNPRIIDFGISIPINLLEPGNYKDYFYIYAPSYYVWSIDINIICFLLHKTDSSLTEQDAVLIATNFVANNKALEIFSPEFSIKYLEACKKEVKKYVGQDKNEVIKQLLANYKTWDNYSLSVVFLRIISFLFPNDIHKNKFVILFSQLLLLNIHPDPSKRLNIRETRSKFEDIFFLDDDVDSYLTLSKFFNQDKIKTTRKIAEDIYNLPKPV